MNVSRRDASLMRPSEAKSKDDGLPRPNPASEGINEELFFEVFTTRIDTVF